MKNFTKMFLAACLLTGFAFSVNAQSVGINADGSAPDNSAMLDVKSTTKGFLLPRMTTTQITEIANPADGLIVFNTTEGKIYTYVAIAAIWKEISFGSGTIFANCGIILDSRDGTIYNTVIIGTQCWMAKNITYLPSVVGPGTHSLPDPYYYVYGYDGTDVAAAKTTTNYQTYGVLYNSKASNTACPTGWHLPTDVEWTTLTTFLGGTFVAGGKMKETGISHWISPNTNATNSTHFSSLPGGYCYDGSFNSLDYYGYWWSNTGGDYYHWNRGMSYFDGEVHRNSFSNSYGFSVRCVKD